MVASRNQMHVMSRAFGSTHNGSMEAYGAQGELESYLNGRRQTPSRAVSIRGFGAVSPKLSAGETLLDSQEITIKGKPATIFVVQTSSGTFCVKKCVNNGACVSAGTYPTADEAKAAANKLAVKSDNLSGAFGALPDFQQNPSTWLLVGVAGLWVGTRFAGAKQARRFVADALNERQETIEKGATLFGLAILGGIAVSNPVA
jgi:hypothetical protein